jgi:hypothetical protein
MPRALQYRTKLAIIRRRLQRRVDKRQRERSESPNQPGNDTPSQRPRHADPVEVDDDAAFADIPSGSGDFDQGSDFGDDWEPQAVTVSLLSTFRPDDTELTDTLFPGL